jgi:hypothetical protein
LGWKLGDLDSKSSQRTFENYSIEVSP